MTVYAIPQFKMTDRATHERYQARFFDVSKRFTGPLLPADENPTVLESVWGRDKLVLISFPDGGISTLGQLRRISRNRQGPQSRRGGRGAAGRRIWQLACPRGTRDVDIRQSAVAR